MNKKVLYLSFNDGTDMRVNKELKSLYQHAFVDFVGINQAEDTGFIHHSEKITLHMVVGKKTSALAVSTYFLKCIGLLIFHRYHSVHIINEPQLIILWPFLFLQKNVVLDIFDSIFLKRNKPGNQWKLIKKIVYAPADVIIVTDENRKTMLPDFARNHALILPNYPYSFNKVKKENNKSSALTIIYYGWLGLHRGTSIAQAMLDSGVEVNIIVAGWVGDTPSELLLKSPRITWHGVIPQQQALELASQADYILCVYAPVNKNNINASPNKIYDAIQVQVPVIINQEVAVSTFVKEQKIGYVLPSYEISDWQTVMSDLVRLRNSFSFHQDLINKFTWESVEPELMKAHKL
ncbi:hypothetical protein DYBT9275_04177 [Dyadobacter sp. CECT 9275]|uniref:Glycosyltransferase n=1 Tax=Dyadobacter helix TaxID=2822344 RepID=A0A916JFC0_9BACT|nr:hypothetical protein [Dyadobacter sp. CECT 9275]CAG5008020.1 hypothetical protein DYBT9275_04177 [Dyadobacter sp. CECT 9275]